MVLRVLVWVFVLSLCLGLSTQCLVLGLGLKSQSLQLVLSFSGSEAWVIKRIIKSLGLGHPDNSLHLSLDHSDQSPGLGF